MIYYIISFLCPINVYVKIKFSTWTYQRTGFQRLICKCPEKKTRLTYISGLPTYQRTGFQRLICKCPEKNINKHIIQDFDVSAHGISEVNLQSSIGQKAIESVYARFRYAQLSKETSK